MKRLLLLFILIILLAVAGQQGFRHLQLWGQTPITILEPRDIALEKGMGLSSLSKQLSTAGLIQNPTLFRLWVKYFSDYSRFQAGPYRFEHKVSPSDIATRMISGEIYLPVLYEITIPEGYTILQVGQKIAEAELGTTEEFVDIARSIELLKHYDIPATSFEGYLFPATYRLTEKKSLEELLEMFVETFFSRLPLNYRTALSERELSLHQAVTFASLIERETRLTEEMPIVSEVIWNRLQRNIPLAIDASLIYGITDYDGDIKNSHLKDASNLYNTRMHPGLPPGPIASPSTAALEAVLTPTAFGYYYYVVDANDFSRHSFSKSLSEHNKKVGAYVRALRSQPKLPKEQHD
ncbi:MAG: endolytic transglycosylase MltG [Bdellovibrionales bacterium]|nr:endolytic transglycosylase MltG [Bdellovibrionales bacterium]